MDEGYRDVNVDTAEFCLVITCESTKASKNYICDKMFTRD